MFTESTQQFFGRPHSLARETTLIQQSCMPYKFNCRKEGRSHTFEDSCFLMTGRLMCCFRLTECCFDIDRHACRNVLLKIDRHACCNVLFKMDRHACHNLLLKIDRHACCNVLFKMDRYAYRNVLFKIGKHVPISTLLNNT